MDRLKLVLGIILLPIAYIIWVLDRVIMVIMPQTGHQNFNDWLGGENIIFAIIRILTLFVLRWIVYWIFGI